MPQVQLKSDENSDPCLTRLKRVHVSGTRSLRICTNLPPLCLFSVDTNQFHLFIPVFISFIEFILSSHSQNLFYIDLY